MKGKEEAQSVNSEEKRMRIARGQRRERVLCLHGASVVISTQDCAHKRTSKL